MFSNDTPGANQSLPPQHDAEVLAWRNHSPEGSPEVSLQLQKLAVEAPIALNYNGINHLVLMASPVDLADLALGFSLSEGLLDHASDLYDLDIQQSAQGISIDLDIASRCFERLKQQRRNLVGRTGCGLCGLESLQAFDAHRTTTPPNGEFTEPTRHIASSAIQRAVTSLYAHQPLFDTTGAVHAAAFADQHGQILLCREDVGRHNALDKLLGALVKHPEFSQIRTAGFVVMSSRASYELIHKCAALGLRCLVTVSAPTSLAVERAQQAGICLIGFAREHRMTVYTQAAQIDLTA